MDIQSLTKEALCGIARILINLCAGVHTLVHARQFQLESQSVPYPAHKFHYYFWQEIERVKIMKCPPKLHSSKRKK